MKWKGWESGHRDESSNVSRGREGGTTKAATAGGTTGREALKPGPCASTKCKPCDGQDKG
jgi:hypothetical protein